MGRVRSFLAKACLALAILSTGAQAAVPPNLGVRSFARLPRPLPTPFDPNADAVREVAAARRRALRENKLLLIEMGANWCPYCRSYAGTAALPTMRRFLDSHFVSVAIDVGRFDHNMAIVDHYELGRLPGIPVLLVIDPTDDRLLNEGEVSLFAHLPPRPGPQDIAKWIAKWAE